MHFEGKFVKLKHEAIKIKFVLKMSSTFYPYKMTTDFMFIKYEAYIFLGCFTQAFLAMYYLLRSFS